MAIMILVVALRYNIGKVAGFISGPSLLLCRVLCHNGSRVANEQTKYGNMKIVNTDGPVGGIKGRGLTIGR